MQRKDSKLNFESPLNVSTTPIPGLLVVTLPVHGDSRGWFKENWQREKMIALGLPDFGPVQNNISFNLDKGVTRGIHAEPWDKFVGIAAGRIFGVWVDLRQGTTFGEVFSTEVDASTCIYVPRGVGNAFQTLEPNTVYSYLVNDHWSAHATDKYTFVNLGDPDLNIPWPIPLENSVLSDKDKHHPALVDVRPMPERRVLVTGANGQLGRALRAEAEARRTIDIDFMASDELDITDADAVNAIDWMRYRAIINAAAYTNVDSAESTDGRRRAWKVNGEGTLNLARAALRHHLVMCHVSSDYVFDGTEQSHSTDESFAPLNVYGQSKAAGDLIVSLLPKHFIFRTSWVIGDGKNFIDTMRQLARKGVCPDVIDDQIGELTYARDLAHEILTTLDSKTDFGTKNVTSRLGQKSWATIAKEVFADEGRDPADVRPISTAEYAQQHPGAAPRPSRSVLD